jgi:hypothetical protein
MRWFGGEPTNPQKSLSLFHGNHHDFNIYIHVLNINIRSICVADELSIFFIVTRIIIRKKRTTYRRRDISIQFYLSCFIHSPGPSYKALKGMWNVC